MAESPATGTCEPAYLNANLENFISEHMEKLDCLRVLEPDMENEEWAKFRTGITRQRRNNREKRILLSEDVNINVRLHASLDA